MEEKKKNKIIVIGSYLIAVIVIGLVILLFPKLQFKNDNFDEVSLGDVKTTAKTTSCISSTRRCVRGELSGGQCIVRISPGNGSKEACETAGGTLSNGSCYYVTGVPTISQCMCPSGYSAVGGLCVQYSKDITNDEKYVTCHYVTTDSDGKTVCGSAMTMTVSEQRADPSCRIITQETCDNMNVTAGIISKPFDTHPVECFSLDSNGKTCSAKLVPLNSSQKTKNSACTAAGLYIDSASCYKVAASNCGENEKWDDTSHRCVPKGTKTCYRLFNDGKHCDVDKDVKVDENGNCPKGYYDSIEACQDSEKCYIVDVTTESKLTSINKDGTISNSYYIGKIKTHGNCEGVDIPCKTNNGTVNKTNSNYDTIKGEKGKNVYECLIYPERACDSSTVTSELGNSEATDTTTGTDNSSGSATVPTIKYDWTSTRSCEKHPQYKSALEADANKADVYYSDPMICTTSSGEQITGYTKRWTRILSCSDPFEPTTYIPSKSYACYADAKTLNDASKAEWLSGPTDELKYKVLVGLDGKSLITDSSQCKIKENKYCYANAATLDEATQSDLLSGPADKLIYLIKDGNGNPIVDKDLCIASACYVNSTNNKYEWAPIGKLDTLVYTKVDIYSRGECRDLSVCMAEKTKDGYKNYKWVSSKTGENGIDDLLSKGYVKIEGIKDASSCNTGACYVNKDNDAIWIVAGEEVPDSYSKVEGTDCVSSKEEEVDTEEKEKENCYVRVLAGGTVEYKWGIVDSDSYKLMDTIAQENCITRSKCYLNLKDDKYYKGDYSLNENYKLVDEENCQVSDEESSEANKPNLVKIELILGIALVTVLIIYYIYKKKKYF